MLRSGEPPLVAFVSSRTSTQTRWARDAVADTLEQSDHFKSWLFEHAPASSEILADSYLSKVRESDLVIWLVEQETTEPVRAEITAALEATRRILMFRITVWSKYSNAQRVSSLHLSQGRLNPPSRSDTYSSSIRSRVACA